MKYISIYIPIGFKIYSIRVLCSQGQSQASHKTCIQNDDTYNKRVRRVKRDEKENLNKKDLFLHRPSYSSISFALCGIPNPSLSSSLHFGQPPSVFSLFSSVGSREPVPFRGQIRPIRTQPLRAWKRSSLSNQP